MNRGYLRYVELMGPLASSIKPWPSPSALFAATSDLRFTSVQQLFVCPNSDLTSS